MSSNILGLSRDSLLRYSPGRTETIILSQKAAIYLLKMFGGWWLRDPSDNLAPHVLLASGKHSDGYVNWWTVLRYANLSRLVARALLDKISQESAALQKLVKGRPGWVLGVPRGMTQFAALMAESIGPGWKSAPLVKNPNKTISWERDTIRSGEPTLLVEDVTTTAGSLEKALTAVRDDNLKREPGSPIEFFPAVGVLTNRSGERTVNSGRQLIVALIEAEMNIWSASDCPLCASGSKALTAKDHWDELMACCAA